jgi:hypothetical protein
LHWQSALLLASRQASINRCTARFHERTRRHSPSQVLRLGVGLCWTALTWLATPTARLRSSSCRCRPSLCSRVCDGIPDAPRRRTGRCAKQRWACLRPGVGAAAQPASDIAPQDRCGTPNPNPDAAIGLRKAKQTADATAISSRAGKDPSLLPTTMKRPLSQQPDSTFAFFAHRSPCIPADALQALRSPTRRWWCAMRSRSAKPTRSILCALNRARAVLNGPPVEGRRCVCLFVCLFVCHRNAPRLSR